MRRFRDAVNARRREFGSSAQPSVGSFRREGVSSQFIPDLRKFDTGEIHAQTVTGGSNMHVVSAANSPIVGIVPGDSVLGQRQGATIHVKGIRVRGYISTTIDSTSSIDINTAVSVHVFLVLDKQCNGAMPTATDIWTAAGPYSFRKVDTKHRFKILRHWEGNIPKHGDMSNGAEGIPVDFDYNWGANNALRVHYDSTAGGTITNVKDNNLVIVYGWYSTSQVISGTKRPTVDFDLNWRTRYIA